MPLKNKDELADRHKNYTHKKHVSFSIQCFRREAAEGERRLTGDSTNDSSGCLVLFDVNTSTHIYFPPELQTGRKSIFEYPGRSAGPKVRPTF